MKWQCPSISLSMSLNLIYGQLFVATEQLCGWNNFPHGPQFSMIHTAVIDFRPLTIQRVDRGTTKIIPTSTGKSWGEKNVWHIQFLKISGQLLCICCCQQVSSFLSTHENKIEIFIWYHLNHPETSPFLSFVLLVAQNKLYVLCCKISKTYQWFLPFWYLVTNTDGILQNSHYETNPPEYVLND